MKGPAVYLVKTEDSKCFADICIGALSLAEAHYVFLAGPTSK